MANGKFIDDVIEYKEDDIEKIQTKPTMYMSYLGQKGALHLVKEMINNAIDECINSHSPGNLVTVYLDETENTVTISDNGRGLPPESSEMACTKLQAGSKFTRSGSGGSAGENGVGMTAANALSSKFQIIIYRYGEKYDIVFENGKKVKDLVCSKIKDKDRHGTTIILQPSRYYLGDDCDISSDELLSWIEKIIFLISSDIQINVGVKKKGKESLINKKYRNKNGLADYIKTMCAKPYIDPIHFIDTMKIKERIHGEEFDRFIGLEVAFTYNQTSIDFEVDSFCNFVHTIDNGHHVDGVRQALVQYLSKQTKESLNAKEVKTLDIIPNDVTQGMVLTLYLSTNLSTQFTG